MGLGVVVAALSVSCAFESFDESENASFPDNVREIEGGVIYGTDNRQEVAGHSDANLRRIAEGSVATVMFKSNVNESNPANISFTSMTAQVANDLCTTPAQRFASDPTPGECSATLIDDDLVLTAGHCVDSDAKNACTNLRFVFGYRKTTSGVVRTITSADVFSCASVPVRKLTGSGLSSQDYAIIRLDRKATPRFTPAVLRSVSTVLSQGVGIAVIGSPWGMPQKIDAAGSVMASGSVSGKFEAVLDTFQANSGSGIFEKGSYQLVGLLTDGADDVVLGPAGSIPAGCNVFNVCPASGCTSGNLLREHVMYVGPALTEYCTANPNNARLCRRENSFSYSATNTSNGTTNVTKQFVFLEPGTTFNFGTCTVPGSTGTGDTLLRLIAPNGSEVASNDDGGGSCGALSQTSYTVPSFMGGLYELRAGCYQNTACSGTVAFTVFGPSGGSFSYSTANTNSAQTGTRNINVSVQAGTTIRVGTCSPAALTPVPPVSLERANFSGNTYLRLFNGASQVAANDNACGGNGSQLSYTATAAGTLQIRAGCSGSGTCSGTVAYTLNRENYGAFSVTNTNSAQQNTQNYDLNLAVGDQVTVGTCGLQGASFTGNTYVRLFRGATQVASNNDECLGQGSLLTYRVATAGTHQMRFGCSGSGSCTGAPVVQVIRSSVIRNGAGLVAYSASNTNSAQQNTTNFPLWLRTGEKINLGTCPDVPGGLATGDTYLRLFGPESTQIASNDDACSDGSGASAITYTVPLGGEGSYELRGGCYSAATCYGSIGLRDQ